jgi:hypothetical protein
MKRKKDTSKIRKYLVKDNLKYGSEMIDVPEESWPSVRTENLKQVLRNNKFLCQIYKEENGQLRLSVSRTMIKPDGSWEENLSWEELMEVKRKVGLGDRCAAEIYPEDKNIVNVANMRHLFILEEPMGWIVGQPEREEDYDVHGMEMPED